MRMKVSHLRFSEITRDTFMIPIPLFSRLAWRALGLAALLVGQFLGSLALCGSLGGCHRSPQTADELAKALPASFSGVLRLQGETEERHIRLEPRELSVRSAHVLGFNRVDYQLLDGSNSGGEAHIRGTISAPGFEIKLERVGSEGSGAEDAIRPETFTGKLGGNLHTLRAEWSTGLGQKATLTLQSGQP